MSMVPPNQPVGSTNAKTVPVDEQLLDHLLNDIVDRKFAIDYIIYPGDIADEGQLEQYEHFDRVSTKIHDRLNITKDRIFFTPGNHDVNWSEQLQGTSREQNPIRWKQRFAPMSSSSSLRDTSAADLYDSPFWKVWRNEEISVISINTAADDGPNQPNHPGTISSTALSSIRKDIISRPLNPKSLKILLIHHHPIQYRNLFPNWVDFSIIQSTDDLLSFCGHHKIDFIIHGHRHQPHFTNYICSNGHEVFIVSAGSLSHNFPSYVYNSISNQYHILTVESRDTESNICRGKFNSFSFSQVSKWRISVHDRDGIEGILPYGPHIPLQTIIRTLSAAVEKQILEKNFCKYNDLLNTESYVQYLSPEVLRGALEDICLQMDLRIFGNNISETIIIRGDK